jgi:hypothetical protein
MMMSVNNYIELREQIMWGSGKIVEVRENQRLKVLLLVLVSQLLNLKQNFEILQR